MRTTVKRDRARLASIWTAALVQRRSCLVHRLIAHADFPSFVAGAARPPFESCLKILAQEGTAAHMKAALAACNPFKTSPHDAGRTSHESALPIAVKRGAWEIARLLVEAGASWRQCVGSQTLLGKVLASPETPDAAALLQALLRAGAHPFWAPDASVPSVVGSCATQDDPVRLERWLRAGGRVDGCPDSGTPLLHAWANPDFGWGGFLTRMVASPPHACWAWALAHGGSWAAPDRHGTTALDLLRRWTHPEARASVCALEVDSALPPVSKAAPVVPDQRGPRTRL